MNIFSLAIKCLIQSKKLGIWASNINILNTWKVLCSKFLSHLKLKEMIFLYFPCSGFSDFILPKRYDICYSNLNIIVTCEWQFNKHESVTLYLYDKNKIYWPNSGLTIFSYSPVTFPGLRWIQLSPGYIIHLETWCIANKDHSM